jgi:hypothetical protein
VSLILLCVEIMILGWTCKALELCKERVGDGSDTPLLWPRQLVAVAKQGGRGDGGKLCAWPIASVL